jgi:hypothetical protein
MSREDWYRKKTWRDGDRADFYARLKRSRGDSSKAQYARIQASCLEDSERTDDILAADELLDLVLHDWPVKSEIAQTYLQKAECARKLRGPDEAFWWLRKALQSEREYPNARTQAYLRFAELSLLLNRRDLHEEVLGILHENRDRVLFPRDAYIFHAAHAIILNDRGDALPAAEHARLALEAAERQHSGFSRHPSIGLVSEPLADIHETLRAISGT